MPVSKFRNLVVTLTGLAAAAPAFAQPVATPDAPLAIVPLAQRLTLAGIFSHAKPVVQLIIAGLVVAIAYAAFVYVRDLVGRKDSRVGGQVFLFALAGGGPLIGLFGAAYNMLDSSIGVANVRPTPSLSILAPGLAEASLCLCLGLLAGAIATIGHRHLTGRAQAIAHAAPASADAPPAHVARAIA
jgi:MotA/TolQ/ExbB proton channel family